MDTQQAYEGIRAHFTDPDATFGYDLDSASCVYRGGNDPASPVRCAVGCILPDAAWNLHANGQGVGVLLKENPMARGYFLDTNTEFLKQAQSAHDGLAQSIGIEVKEDYQDDPDTVIYRLAKAEFIRQLDKLAADFDLTVVTSAK